MNKINRKKIFTIAACIIVAAVTAVVLINVNRNSGSGKQGTSKQQTETRVFVSGSQTITLNKNGTFSARMAHNNNKDGSYTETMEGSITIISFSYQGTTVKGRLQNGVLSIPREWDDGHGHGNTFRLK